MGSIWEFVLAVVILSVGIAVSTLMVGEVEALRSLPVLVRFVVALLGGGVFFLACVFGLAAILRRKYSAK